MLALAAEAAQAGEVLDEGRWRDLFRQHGPFLRRAIARLGRPGPHVDDVVQEAFLTAYRRRDDLPVKPGLMRAWLYRAAKNHWLHEQRSTARRLQRHEAVAAQPTPLSPTPEEHAETKEDVEGLRRLLEELPLEMREAVVLVELEGLRAVEAAALLDIGEDTFRSRLRRGRERLWAAWQEQQRQGDAA